MSDSQTVIDARKYRAELADAAAAKEKAGRPAPEAPIQVKGWQQRREEEVARELERGPRADFSLMPPKPDKPQTDLRRKVTRVSFGRLTEADKRTFLGEVRSGKAVLVD